MKDFCVAMLVCIISLMVLWIIDILYHSGITPSLVYPLFGVTLLYGMWCHGRALTAERQLEEKSRYCHDFRARMDAIYYPIVFDQLSVDRLLRDLSRPCMVQYTPQQLKRLELGMSSEAFIMWEERQTDIEVGRRHEEEVLRNTRRQNLSLVYDDGCHCCSH